MVAAVGSPIASREFVLQLPVGERVAADERFFVIAATDETVQRAGWTPQEVEVMYDHKWWTAGELEVTSDTVFPNDLANMLKFSGW